MKTLSKGFKVDRFCMSCGKPMKMYVLDIDDFIYGYAFICEHCIEENKQKTEDIFMTLPENYSSFTN